MHPGDAPCRDDARRTRGGQLGEHAPGLRLVAGRDCQMRESERRPSDSARYALALFIGRARLVEATEDLEGSRETGVGAIEAWIELDGHPEVEDRSFVLAGEIVGVA